jgi:hypothetical protein
VRHLPLVRAVTLIGLALALAASPPASARRKSRPAAAAKAAAHVQPKEPPLPAPQGKLAVFTFEGEGAHRVQQQVIASLRARGLKVITNLRPVDSAEQYREMAVTLNLAAYVDGEVTVEGNDGSATIFVRSGASGMRTASATFAADRHQLTSGPGLGKDLWDKIGPALGQACADASKPRKAGREPMRINAGTPLTDADTAAAAD